jgi:hypothetical protein
MIETLNANEEVSIATEDDKALALCAARVRELMNSFISGMSPQDRDRRMQFHLAQARGPIQNAELLRHSMNLRIRILARRAADRIDA